MNNLGRWEIVGDMVLLDGALVATINYRPNGRMQWAGFGRVRGPFESEEELLEDVQCHFANLSPKPLRRREDESME